MLQEENNRRSGSESCEVTPKKLQRTPRNGGSDRRDIMSQEVKRRIHCTPYNSPDKYSKTPQSGGSLRKDGKSQLEGNKRKIQSSHNESVEKIQKTSSTGKFINTLIGQWSKHMGVQTPLSQTGGAQENPATEEMKQMYAMEERKIQKLQKKLLAAEGTISSLTASHEAELQAKEEILQQLNSDWESITKYYYEISESLKGFQQHKENLTALYNDVIVVQQSTVKKLQQELNTMKLKDEEHQNIVNTIEKKVVNQEKRMQEMMIAETELKKQFEDMKNKSILERKHLQSIHEKEKLELTKKQENLTSINQELQVQLQRITEEKQNFTNVFAEKENEIIKLQEEIVTRKNKIEDLLCQNAEFSVKYEKLIEKEEELSKELQSRIEEIDKLRENLSARQEIESSLAKDLDMIENKYKNAQTNFANVEKKLKETQLRNLNLEKSLEDMKLNNEQKIMELNEKIEVSEKEKERVFLEKNSKIKEHEDACKLLKEKHDAEITSLKKEFDAKLAEMKKTISTQNSAFVKLNETLNKMKEENQIKEANYLHQRIKENRNILQEKLKERMEQVAESNVTETIKRTGSQSQTSQAREMKQQQYQDQENVDRPKTIFVDKSEKLNSEQDIYNFNATDINDELQNILSPTKKEKNIRYNINSPNKVSDYMENYSYSSRNKDLMPSNVQIEEKQEKKSEDKNSSTTKKKIFKTRGTGLRQYGTPKKSQYGTVGKIYKK